MSEVGEILQSIWDRLNQISSGWLGVIVHAAIEVLLGYDAYIAAAAIAFFALFSLFPLILLTIAFGSIWIDARILQTELFNQLEFIAPSLRILLGQNLQQIVRTRQSVTGFALVTLLWSASTVFYVITGSLDQIWDVVGYKPIWRDRGIALLTTFMVTGLLIVFIQMIVSFFNMFIPNNQVVDWELYNHYWGAVLNVLLFSLLYRFLPHLDLRWSDVLPGAVLGGILWQFAKSLFRLFIESYLSQSNLVYGSVATIIAFLMWAYFSSIIFLFGAYINVGYYDLRASRERKGK